MNIRFVCKEKRSYVIRSSFHLDKHILKTLIVIKTIVLLILALSFQATAKVSAQTISLTLKNAALSNALEQIGKQTKYDFSYNDRILKNAKPVNISLHNETLETSLQLLFAEQQLTYEIRDRIIIIKEKKAPGQKPVSSVIQHKQEIIRGRVTNENGEPMSDVTVQFKGTSTGTKTNTDGQYDIGVIENSTNLVFTYIGYSPEEISIAGRQEINVVLKMQDASLDEVVVVGYGTQKRSDVTGAIVSIRPQELENTPYSNVVQSLQGKLPGVNITNTGTSAEGDTRLRVRAQNSINADAGPLIILDGIQFEGFLSEISPNDIESIEVLKDASSAAIYGARGANGVMLITTKRGVKGKTRLALESMLSTSNIINRPDMMDATQFYNFKQRRMGFVSSFEEQQYQNGVNTDWLDYATQTGFKQDHNLSISGGAEKTKFFIAGNASRTDGVARNDVYNRYALRINMDTEITPWLTFGTASTIGYYDRPGEGANISNATRMNPLTAPYDEDGKLNFQPNPDDLNIVNPLEGLNIQKEDVARRILTNNYIQVDFPFVEGLSFKTLTGYNYRARLIEQYSSSSNTLRGSQVGGSATVNNQNREEWSIENILSYTRDFGRHNVFLTGVYTARAYETKFHDNTGVGFPGDHMSYYQFRLATTLTPSDQYIKESSLSQMFRANYSYDSRYLFTFTVRRDGFSAFGANNKYSVFPSAAVGWNMEREPFMQSLTWLDRSKLRLSLGESGNQAIGAYSSMPTMANQYYLDNAGDPLIGFYPNQLADPTLSWETTRQLNIGWDFSLLKNRLSGTVDAYFSNTRALLLNKQIPQINGVTTIRQNIGRTKSSGIEVALSSINVQSDNFSWQTNANFTYAKNEIVDVGLFDDDGNPLDNVASSWFIGRPIGVIYTYGFDGIWQETDDILHSHMSTARPGDVRIKDHNNDGVITVDDRHIIGQNFPKYTVGLNNTFAYKDLSLSFFIYASQGATRFTEHMNTYFNGSTTIRQREWWTPENKTDTYPANRDDSNPYSLNYFGKTNDASFIRLSDISLAYKIPQSITNKVNIDRLELFTNVKNVLTLTRFIGLDPEYESDFGIPQIRSFLFGARIGF